MFPTTRSEDPDLRPAGKPLLDALAERLLALAPGIVVQPAAVSPWTAYYLSDKLVALARPAAAGAAAAIDIALLPIEVAGAAANATALDEPAFVDALAAAVRLAPTSSSRVAGAWGGSYGDDPVGAVLLALDAVGTAAYGLLRRRTERAVAAATDTKTGLAILDAARQEARRRANSLTIGCFGAIGAGLVLMVAVLGLGSALARAISAPWLAAALWPLILIGPVLLFWQVRRRYPSPPQRGIDRLGRDLFLLILVLIAGLIVYGIVSPTQP
jgi:hypothetical protein